MGFLEELEETLRDEDETGMKYSGKDIEKQPTKAKRTLPRPPSGRPEEEEGVVVTAKSTAVKKKKKLSKKEKALTLNNIFGRVQETPVLGLASILIFLGIMFSVLSAMAYHSRWKSDGSGFGEEPSFVYKYADEVTILFFYFSAMAIIYMFLSVQYRTRFKLREDGKKRSLVPGLPKKPGKKLVSILSALAPVFMLLIPLLGIYWVAVNMDYSGDTFEVAKDGYKKLFRAAIFHSLIAILIPLALLFATAGTPRGLKKTGKYLRLNNHMVVFIVLALVFALLSFVFYFMVANDNYQYWDTRGTEDYDEISDTIQTYYPMVGLVFLFCTYVVSAFVLLNLKSKKRRHYRLELTPSVAIFGVGLLLMVLNILINLTIFNKDFNYDGEYLGWFLLQYLFGTIGLFLILGATAFLMAEYTLHRGIATKKLCLEPGELWREMKKKNYIFRKIL